MKKFLLPVVAVMVLSAVLSLSALTDPRGSTLAAPAPTRTATPRDFTKLAPDGKLLDSAVKAESAIVLDSNSGKVLFEKNADKKQYPASITKIMTCLLAIEKLDPATLVTVGKLPTLDKGSTTMGLKEGETLSVENLLYGMMMVSGNDAAAELAILMSGESDPDEGIKKFAEMMNNKAQELGMTNSHFVNPHGLPNDDHYTTARDMAKLAVAARKQPLFVKIVSTYKYTMPATNKTNEPRHWTNSNKLISENPDEVYAYQYATGIKTGYTTAAKQTLVTSAHKDNMDLVAVVLRDNGQEDKWTDSVTMFEYAFHFYDTLNLGDLLASQPMTVTVENAADTESGGGQLDLELQPEKPAFLTDTKNEIEKLRSDPSQFERKESLNPDLKAPIKKDSQVGTVTFSHKGEVVLTCKLLASKDVAERSSPLLPGKQPGTSAKPGESANAPGGTLGRVLLWILAVLLLLVIAVIIIRMVNLQRRSRRYRHYNYRNQGRRRR